MVAAANATGIDFYMFDKPWGLYKMPFDNCNFTREGTEINF